MCQMRQNSGFTGFSGWLSLPAAITPDPELAVQREPDTVKALPRSAMLPTRGDGWAADSEPRCRVPVNSSTLPIHLLQCRQPIGNGLAPHACAVNDVSPPTTGLPVQASGHHAESIPP